MKNSTKRRWYLRLALIAPTVMVVFGVLDISLRFMPLRWLAFRAWETMTERPAPDAPFAANQFYYNARSYGDLSNSGNLPAFREYHEEIFTTDEFGFRNQPSKGDTNAPAALLIGTSFSAGDGVSDAETLSSRLSKLSHCRVYNAGGPTDFCNNARRVATRLGMQKGTVIFEFAERNWYPRDFLDCMDAQGMKKNFDPHSPLADYFHRAPPPSRWQAWVKQLPPSRLEIIAVKLYKLLQNDSILPNTPAAAIARRTLTNGDVMLFPVDQPRQFTQARDPSWIPFYCAWFARELQKQNLSLVVVLLPEKFTVYRPFYTAPDPIQGGEYMDQVEAALKKAGFTTVNLLPVFRKAAEEGLADHHYIYRRDDTHWNPDGVELAAKTILMGRELCNEAEAK